MNIVISSSYPYVDETGAARVAKLLACELAKTHTVLFVCLGDEFNVTRKNKMKVCTIPSYSIGVAKSPRLSNTITDKLEKTLEEFKPDIVHAQNIISNELLIIAWAVQHNIPLTITFHQLPSEAIGHISPKLKQNSVGKVLQYVYSNAYTKKILKRTNSVIALNKFVEKSVREIDNEIPITIINNGIDLEDYLSVPIKNQTKKIVCTFLGSYFPRKNQEYLIKVMKYLPENFELHLFGNKQSGKHYVKKLNKVIDENALQNVYIHDFINHRKVLKQYAKTDYFVSASHQEAQSLVIIESLATGTPVVGLSNETIDELITDKVGLRLQKDTTPEVFARKLIELTRNSTYKTLAQSAKDSASKFNVSEVSLKVIKHYNKTITHHLIEKKFSYNTLFEEFIPENIDELLQKYQRNKLNGLVRFTVVTARVGEAVAELLQAAKDREK